MYRSCSSARPAGLALLLVVAGCAARPAPATLAPAPPAPATQAPAPPAPPTPAPATPTLVNASSLGAYNDGLYDGFITVGELHARGDFGFGAADRNDGELTVLDGVYYCARADGTVVALGGDASVPLASVTQFHAEHRLHLAGPLTRPEFEARLDDWLPGASRMLALRVHGRLTHVLAGSSAAQSKPYRRFRDVKAEYNLISRDGVIGTLVGFRMPTMNSRYYHFHLISDDRRAGGHVDDETLEDIDVEAEELHRIEIILPNSPAFVAADRASSAPAPSPAPTPSPAPAPSPAPSAAPARP